MYETQTKNNVKIMKKHRIKNFKRVSIYSLLGFLFFTLVNCNDDDLTIVDKNNVKTNTEFKTEKVYFKEFSTNSRLLNKINKAKTKLTRQENIANKEVFASDNSFSIETDFANYIERENGKHSYTFAIHRENPEYLLENLVLNSNDSLGYDLYIVQYDITQLELEQLYNGQNPIISHKAIIHNFEDNEIVGNIFNKVILEDSSLCLTTNTIVGNSCPGPKHHTVTDIAAGQYCPYADEGYTLYNTVTISSWEPCSSVVSGGDGSDDSGNSNDGSIGESDNGAVDTTPTTMSPEDWVKKDFKMQLDDDQEICFGNLTDQQEEALMHYVGTLAGDTMNANVFDFANEALNTICSSGEVDFKNQIILDSSFVNSPKIKCLYDKLVKATNNNLFKDMISLFSKSTNKFIKFSVGNAYGDFGITNGNINIPHDYNIIIDSTMENYSNLANITSLCHELIHAYMFSSLEDGGYITFDQNGQPKLIGNINCNNSSSININTLTTNQKFEVLICALNNSNNLDNQWSHELFNSNVFSSQDFRISLSNFLQINHDWNNETAIFQSQCVSTFGQSNWINETAVTASWIGLDLTSGFNNYLSNYNSNQQNFITNFTIYLSTSKSNCP